MKKKKSKFSKVMGIILGSLLLLAIALGLIWLVIFLITRIITLL